MTSIQKLFGALAVLTVLSASAWAGDACCAMKTDAASTNACSMTDAQKAACKHKCTAEEKAKCQKEGAECKKDGAKAKHHDDADKDDAKSETEKSE